MKHHKAGLLCCVILLFLASGKVLAQDIVYEQEEQTWNSDNFVTTSQTRIEWVGYPSSSASESTFEIWVVDEATLERIHYGSGLSGMIFVDTSFFAFVDVQTTGLDNWLVRLYHLDQIPNTSLDPLTTTSDPNTTTPPSNQPIHTITVAVFTELPPDTYMVQAGYVMIGILSSIALVGLMFAIILRNNDIMLMKRVKEDTPEPEPET